MHNSKDSSEHVRGGTGPSDQVTYRNCKATVWFRGHGWTRRAQGRHLRARLSAESHRLQLHSSLTVSLSLTHRTPRW